MTTKYPLELEKLRILNLLHLHHLSESAGCVNDVSASFHDVLLSLTDLCSLSSTPSCQRGHLYQNWWQCLLRCIWHSLMDFIPSCCWLIASCLVIRLWNSLLWTTRVQSQPDTVVCHSRQVSNAGTTAWVNEKKKTCLIGVAWANQDSTGSQRASLWLGCEQGNCICHLFFNIK